jgi:prepilin-type N-terminal cleavage/methylation domain-containing protein
MEIGGRWGLRKPFSCVSNTGQWGTVGAERAFTLVEMLIVLVIMGILAAISIPAYSKHVSKAKQSDAKSQLVAIQQGQEIYKFQNGKYATHAQRANISGWRETVGPYTFSITAQTDSTFAAQAAGNIDSDATIDTWTINQDGTLTNTVNDV